MLKEGSVIFVISIIKCKLGEVPSLLGYICLKDYCWGAPKSFLLIIRLRIHELRIFKTYIDPSSFSMLDAS